MTSTTDTSSRPDISILRAPLLDTDAVAVALGVTPRHIRRLVAERRIPFLKVGRFVRFDPAALNVWLDDLRVEPERSTARDYVSWRVG
ncbi:MAG TPA: helix-turn-helix domain-containing protein [Acidimicrobiales bacterium]|nr:helix-turn-helix domain-containing protein [Acidimicrobiales bacterium]